MGSTVAALALAAAQEKVGRHDRACALRDLPPTLHVRLGPPPKRRGHLLTYRRLEYRSATSENVALPLVTLILTPTAFASISGLMTS